MSNFKNFIHRTYPNLTENVHVSSAIYSMISFQVSKNFKKTLSKQLNEQYFLMDWFCFECKKPIQINVQNLLEGNGLHDKSYFCENHQTIDRKINKRISISWIRYENAFSKKLQQIIQNKWN